MSESTDAHETFAAAGSRGRSRTKRVAASSTAARREFPEWAPWAVLGALIVAGGVGSRLVQASAGASDATASNRTAAGAASAESASADARISVLHLVVSDRDTMMGKSLKITRTKDEAKARAGEALARARKGEDFKKLISEYTEEPHTDQTHGEISNFSRKDAIPAFSDAAFALKAGQLSGVVDTPFGYMVILRTK